MKVSVRYGRNSKRMRFTKCVFEKSGTKDSVELILEVRHTLLKPNTSPRQNWDKAFKQMHKNGDDKLLLNDIFEDESLVHS